MAAHYPSSDSTLPNNFLTPPVFDSVEEERKHLKIVLAGSFRLFGKLGFAEGVAGHITVRDPEHKDCFWVNPLGVSFNQMKASDLLLVDHTGKIVEGRLEVNRAAFAIHSRIHAARPDVIAAAHSHSLWGKTFSTLGIKVAPLTQDACAFYEDHVIFNDYTGVVNDTEEGDKIALALKDKKAAILENHGLLTVGKCIEEAVWWFITMERSCQAQIQALQTGIKPKEIRHEVAEKTQRELGNSMVGFIQFQPLWQDIYTQCGADFSK